MANGHPVVLVHGLFGWGPGECADFPYWGTGRSVPCPLPRHEASVGPISSVHDRACELAFQLRGGRVDYGRQHAAEAGHRRYGKTWPRRQALHPGWSAERPVHLVGHSMGAPTILMLQQLLAEDFFGWGSTERWVCSISSISGVLNGSTATYLLGCDEETGLLDADSAGHFLARGIELILRATGSVFDRVYDFDLDHWDLGRDHDGDESLRGYLERVAASPMFAGTDNAAYCITLQGMLEQNRRCRTYPDTYYFSYVTEQTIEGILSGHHYPQPDMNPLAIPFALYIGAKRFARPFYPRFRSQDWWANDGLVSVYSQQYPRSAGKHPVGGAITAGRRSFTPGRWYHQTVGDTDHIDIVALPELHRIGHQKRFYQTLYQRLANL